MNQKSFGIYTPLHTQNHNASIIDRGMYIPYFIIIKEEARDSKINCELVYLKNVRLVFITKLLAEK